MKIALALKSIQIDVTIHRKEGRIMEDRGFYIGIDIDDTYAVTSYFSAGMTEPATVSMVAGSEVFQIPVRITKKKDLGQWYIGEEAERVAKEQQGIAIDGLLTKALHQEELLVEGESYPAEELLVLFIRKLISYASGLNRRQELEGMAISVEKVTKELSQLFFRIGEKLGIASEKMKVLDRKSAFYYFTMNQHADLWFHDVCLYDYRPGQMKCLRMERNLSTTPQLVTIEEEIVEIDENRQDETFYQVLQEHMRGHIISAAYLVGNAFEGGWMQASLAFLCRGRRAFMGKNLYAKGACYGMLVAAGEVPWAYVYLGDNEMKVNVSIKVRKRGNEEFYTLISAGDNWYETKGFCEVILDATKEVPIWLQLPNSRQAKVETLTLSDLPDRENRTTRLQIEAEPLSDAEVKIRIKDLGFGEIVKCSGMTWEYIMSVIP